MMGYCTIQNRFQLFQSAHRACAHTRTARAHRRVHTLTVLAHTRKHTRTAHRACAHTRTARAHRRVHTLTVLAHTRKHTRTARAPHAHRARTQARAHTHLVSTHTLLPKVCAPKSVFKRDCRVTIAKVLVPCQFRHSFWAGKVSDLPSLGFIRSSSSRGSCTAALRTGGHPSNGVDISCPAF
jgi:hypothetical protein